MALTAKPYLREISIDPQAEIDRDRYPFNIPAAVELSAPMTLHADVTFLVGENGAGKSTVLEAIAVGMGLPAEGGTRNVSRVQQAASPLHECLKDASGITEVAYEDTEHFAVTRDFLNHHERRLQLLLADD